MVDTLGKETVDKIMAPKLPNYGKTAEEILANDDRNDAADVTDAVSRWSESALHTLELFLKRRLLRGIQMRITPR